MGRSLPVVAGGAGEGEEEGAVLLLLHQHQGVPHLQKVFMIYLNAISLSTGLPD